VLDASWGTITSIAADAVDGLIASGVAKGGMAAKLQAARRALSSAVVAVRISDVTALADPDAGTRLTSIHSPA
jgi:acetylglutamate kinase